jgi:hypothetical protein
MRNARSRLALQLAGTLLIAAMTAGGAQAQTIHPSNTTITGTAVDPTINYEGTIWVCDTGTAVGETGADLDYVNLELDFFGNCNVNGLGATITCSEASDYDEEDGDKNPLGTARLRALTGDTNLGEVDRLNEGFFCDIVITGLCTITFAEQELPIDLGGVLGANSANLLNEGGATVIDADVDVNATRVGSSLCGPTNGVMALTADYDVDPDISFD